MTRVMQKYETLDHTADLKIKAFGKTLPEVFVNMALGLAGQQAETDGLGKLGAAGDWEKIFLESDNLESLLIDWLNEILYRSDVSGKIYSKIEVLKFSEKPHRIETRIKGVKIERKNIEIKAATYHDLVIKKVDERWEAVVVFDI